MRMILIFLFIFVNPCFAVEDFYQFNKTVDEERFASLTNQFRCLVCQNQTIAESNAVLANDLRAKIYKKIQNGETDQQIIDYLVTRYGTFILYRPPFNIYTLGLWIAPFLLLLSGLGYLIYSIRKKA